ncbi:MAG TPA: pitrilysin family protein [Stellaceae bacterium]|nr:pitrilysin family protein [Stellaceae bacterium]
MIRTLAAAALLVSLIAAPAAAANKIEEVKSAGGITAWLVEDHSLPVVTMDVSFRGGAALDPADKAGVSTLAADLLDEGAGELDSQAYQGRLEDLATSIEFSASEDAMGASLRTITANLAPALDLLRLALSEPRFDDVAVARVRSQLLAELARDAREPRYIASRLWWRNVYDGHPYARPVRGTPESIGRVTTPDLRRVVHDHFGRDAMIIGVVGDVSADTLKSLLDSTFGSLPAHAAAGKVADVTAAAKKPLLLAKLPIPQSVVTFGQPGIKRDDSDWYAAYVVNHILGGGGFSSRLTTEVREKRGLAYSVYSELDPMQHSGVILGGVATQNDRVAKSIEIIRAEWRRMRDSGPTQKELDDAKTFLTGSFPLSLDSTGHIAGILVAIQRDALGIDYLERRKTLIESVTLDDAKRVARRLLDPDKLSFVVVGSPDKLGGAQEVAPNGS